RRAPAIRDHGGGDAGAVASVFPVDVLDNLFAPLVLEIDVDIRWFAPLGRDEPLEQQIGAVGVDFRHAKAETDRGIGGRAAPLAKDALRAWETHGLLSGSQF